MGAAAQKDEGGKRSLSPLPAGPHGLSEQVPGSPLPWLLGKTRHEGKEERFFLPEHCCPQTVAINPSSSSGPFLLLTGPSEGVGDHAGSTQTAPPVGSLAAPVLI